MAFLTMWTYLMLTIHHIVAAIVTVHGYIKIQRPTALLHASTNSSLGDEMEESLVTSWYLKVSWCLAAVVQVFTMVVTCIFYIGLYPYMDERKTLSFRNINVHAINTVLIVTEAALTARPVRLLHSVYPIAYGVIYAVFSFVYWEMDKQNNVLYPNILDWNKPGQTFGVLVGISFLLIPVLQFVHFGIFMLRLYIFRKVYKEDFFNI